MAGKRPAGNWRLGCMLTGVGCGVVKYTPVKLQTGVFLAVNVKILIHDCCYMIAVT